MSHTPRARRPAAGGPGRGGRAAESEALFYTNLASWSRQTHRDRHSGYRDHTMTGSIRLRLSESAPPAGRRLFKFKYVLY